MIITPVRYVRRPFEVEAVEVTADNMIEVALWCGGDICDSEDDEEPIRGTTSQLYIKVPVKKPLNERQTRAYVDDWVLLATTSSRETGPPGFKVYTPKAFLSSFEKKVEHMLATVERMQKRTDAEDRAEEEGMPEAQAEMLFREVPAQAQ